MGQAAVARSAHGVARSRVSRSGCVLRRVVGSRGNLYGLVSQTSQFQHFGKPGGNNLGAGHILAVGRPCPHLFFGNAEQAGLQLVDIVFHLLEMSGPVAPLPELTRFSLCQRCDERAECCKV